MPADLDALLAELRTIREALARPAGWPLLLTPAEAAEFVGLSRSALYRLVSADAIKAVDVPNAGVRFRRSDLEKLVERLKPGRRKARSAVP